MEHFYQNIHGWCGFKNLYARIVEQTEPPSHFVEVGAWLGKSTSIMAVEILNSNKDIKFDVVDTWDGRGDTEYHAKTKEGTLYEDFLANMEPVIDVINPIRQTSIEASKLYENNTLDFIFIDASHDYENVKLDLKSWFPKLKKGGIIAGHDYAWGPGVKKAVDEFFNHPSQLFPINPAEDGCWVVYTL